MPGQDRRSTPTGLDASGHLREHAAADFAPLHSFLARAMYDNVSEMPQELSFSRGDLLVVLERDPIGYEGWWICNHRGRVGIAPGNRLDILGLAMLWTKTDATRGSVEKGTARCLTM
ncbi:unnamed protein product [Protopolystoma xenopodis]|uniref:SH3 domain-containing protein n=1 Tax=Protopolystoma xenopodis TaxID=117903 RepID=A0A3S5BUE4_9PLAT|nr:unnamed protein product [Protopolystoma xenopodis]